MKKVCTFSAFFIGLLMCCSSLFAEEPKKNDRVYNIIKIDDTKDKNNKDLQYRNLLWDVEKIYKRGHESDKIFDKPTNIIIDNDGFERC